MNELGYYAMDTHKNLYKFEWSESDDLYIFLLMGDKVKVNPKDYEIIQIGII